MPDFTLKIGRWRAISIAVLSGFIFFLATLVIADGVLWLVVLGQNPIPKVNQADIAWAFLIGTLFLFAAIFVWRRLVISIRRVGNYLTRCGFEVCTKRNRLEATKDDLQISLFLEGTWQAYSPFPRSTLLRDESGKWAIERSGSYDPSYMYKKGSLQILRRASPLAEGEIRDEFELKQSARNVDVIVNKPVGAWMGQYLIQAINAAVKKATEQ